MTVPAAAARFLRADDDVELVRATTEPATILSIADRVVTLAAAGARAHYAAGATVTLLERGGHAIDAAEIHELGGAEFVDLSSIAADGDVDDVALPHAIGALLLDGDVIELDGPTGATRVWIDAISRAPSVVALTAPLGGDFSVGRLRLVTPVGRLVVDDAETWGTGFPMGTDVAIDWDDAGTIRTATRTVAWSDPASATVWTTAPAPATWLGFSPAAPAIATDRGRWLWVKLRLRGARAHATDGAAVATPTIHALRIVAPRQSYLSYLPALYSRRDDDDPSGALFLERFLAIAERRLTQIETRYEDVARRLNPAALDRDWIDFAASWFALVFDPSWPIERRARLLAEIFDLYHRRGTVEAMRRFVEIYIYTDHAPSIIEGFQLRPRAGHVLGAGELLGAVPLGTTETSLTSAADDGYAHRFTIIAYVDDDCDLQVAGTALRALVDAVKPAHTIADLRVSVPRSRLELESTIGVDFALGDGRTRPVPLGAMPPTTNTIL
jgi:phage tail-like protein